MYIRNAKNTPIEPLKSVRTDRIPNMSPVEIPKKTRSQKILSVVLIKMTTAQIDD
jgi:hypothetical protein